MENNDKIQITSNHVKGFIDIINDLDQKTDEFAKKINKNTCCIGQIDGRVTSSLAF